MSIMYLQILYSVKKKEGKIIDLSILTEDEKIALLELYKAAYEKTKLENSISMSVNESEKASKTEESVADAENNNISVTKLHDTTVSDTDDNRIDTTYEYADDTISVTSEDIGSNMVSDYQEYAVANASVDLPEDIVSNTTDDLPKDIVNNTTSNYSEYVSDNTEISYDIELEESIMDNQSYGEESYAGIELGNDTTRRASFEYTSFTPYKPKYDDMELNNNFFSVDGNMGMKVDVSNKPNVGTYDYKLNKSKSNIKKTNNGAYTIADSYTAASEKKEVSYLNIITVIFSIIGLGIYVTQFIYHYDTLELMKYVCDFCFTISILMIFVSAISKSNILHYVKGITMLLAFGFHFIVVGVEAYQSGLYKLLHQELDYDFVYGVVILAYLVILYVFMILSAVNSMIDKKILAYIADVFGILLVIVLIILMKFSSMSNDLIWFYDKIPNYLGLIIYTIAAAVSNIKNR